MAFNSLMSFQHFVWTPGSGRDLRGGHSALAAWAGLLGHASSSVFCILLTSRESQDAIVVTLRRLDNAASMRLIKLPAVILCLFELPVFVRVAEVATLS